MASEKFPTKKINHDAPTVSGKLTMDNYNDTGKFNEWLKEQIELQIRHARVNHTEGMRALIDRKSKLEKTDRIPATFQPENSPSDLSRPDLIYEDQTLDQFLRVARILYERDRTIYPLSTSMPREKYIFFRRILQRLYTGIDKKSKSKP